MKFKLIGSAALILGSIILLSGLKMEKSVKVSSAAFGNNQQIPDKYISYFANVSPQITWQPVETAQSYVFIMDDPDAPSAQHPYPTPYVHCVIYDIPHNVTEFAEGVLNAAQTIEEVGAVTGTNQANQFGYYGPKPPLGTGPHRYFFKIYALNVPSIELSKGATKELVMQKVERYKIGYGELIGVYAAR